MNQSTLSIRIDAKDKKEFEEFCEATGLNISTAVNMFVKAVLREGRIPFEIKSTLSEEYVLSKLLEAEKEMVCLKKNKTSEEVFENISTILGENV